MAGAQKKVVVRPFDAEPVTGYLPAGGFAAAGELSLMHTSGRLMPFLLRDIKHIAYVRDFNSGDAADPERLIRKTFPARPRAEGLWLRMTFRDGDIVEGLADLDLRFLDAIATDQGLSVTPPDTRSNTLRLYVPRTALTGLELLGVVTSAAKRKAATKPAREPQPGLFGDS